MQSKQFQERLDHLLYEHGLIKTGIPAFTEMVDRDGIMYAFNNRDVMKSCDKH
jgi:hypothetical protein